MEDQAPAETAEPADAPPAETADASPPAVTADTPPAETAPEETTDGPPAEGAESFAAGEEATKPIPANSDPAVAANESSENVPLGTSLSSHDHPSNKTLLEDNSNAELSLKTEAAQPAAETADAPPAETADASPPAVTADTPPAETAPEETTDGPPAEGAESFAAGEEATKPIPANSDPAVAANESSENVPLGTSLSSHDHPSNKTLLEDNSNTELSLKTEVEKREVTKLPKAGIQLIPSGVTITPVAAKKDLPYTQYRESWIEYMQVAKTHMVESDVPDAGDPYRLRGALARCSGNVKDVVDAELRIYGVKGDD